MFGSEFIGANGNYPFKGWTHRDHVTIAAFKTLTNVPTLIDETVVGANFFTFVLNGGGDIRVSTDPSGYDRLSIEVVTCDTPGEILQLWVKVPTTSSSVTTDIYIWYGKSGETQPAASAAFGSEDVWNDTFSEYHLDDASGSRSDATANGYTLAETGTISAVAGQIGDGIECPGTTGNYLSRVESGSEYDFSSTDLTFSGWFVLDTKTVDMTIFYVGNGSFSPGQQVIHFRYDQSDDAMGFVTTNGLIATQLFDDIGGTIATGAWIHYALRYTNSSDLMEINLNNQGWVTITGLGLHHPANTQLVVGMRANNSQPWDGKLDEFKISKTLRSDDYMDYQYENQETVADLITYITTV